MSSDNRMLAFWDRKRRFFSVFLDIITWNFLCYATVSDALAIHRQYKGSLQPPKADHTFRTGWIPQQLSLKPAGMYRIEGQNPVFPDLSTVPDFSPGIKLLVPIDYYTKRIYEDWPFLVIDQYQPLENGSFTYTNLFLLHKADLLLFFTGKKDLLKEYLVTLTYIPYPGAALQTVEHWVCGYTKYPPRTKKILSFLFRHELVMQLTDEERYQYDHTHPFYTRLGLRYIGAFVYRMSGGIARACYPDSVLSSTEQLQEIVIPYVIHIIEPLMYVKEELSGRHFFVVLFENTVGDRELAQRELSEDEVIRVLQGDYQWVLDELFESEEYEKLSTASC